MVMGLPILPRGGRVGVEVGLGVAVCVAVGVCSGVRVGDGVDVGKGGSGVQAVIRPKSMIRVMQNNQVWKLKRRWCAMSVSDPFCPGWVGIFFNHKLLCPLHFFSGKLLWLQMKV